MYTWWLGSPESAYVSGLGAEGAPAVSLKWDYFLDKVKERESPDGQESIQNHVNAFRVREWRGMVRLLAAKGFEVSAEIEPHWIGPGKAVLWQEQVSSHIEQGAWVESNNGWHPTAPLPVASADGLGLYLLKGFRLRPPVAEGSEVEDVEDVEGAPPPEAYLCTRHEHKGVVSSPTYKAYRRHCRYHGETVQYPPKDSSSLYICPICGYDTNSKRLAGHHARGNFTRKHTTVLSMEQMAKTLKGAREDVRTARV
jgi:hypothetical protein